MPLKKILLDAVFVILSLLCLIYPALDNGYPLVYSDTGTYIASGFSAQVPVDRPIMYCFFVRHISMACSLWFVIVMQAIVVTIVLLLTLRYFVKPTGIFRYTFIIILTLSLTTGISNYTSQVMPDIFSALAIICLSLLLIDENRSRPCKITLSILVIFSNMAHSSNLLTGTLFIFCVMILTLIFKNSFPVKKENIYFVVLLTITSWLMIPLMNLSLGAGFKVSRAPNIFLMGRLIESGVLNEYLHDHCQQKEIQLCQYMDHLPQESCFFL
jgi:hypothetical protein